MTIGVDIKFSSSELNRVDGGGVRVEPRLVASVEGFARRPAPRPPRPCPDPLPPLPLPFTSPRTSSALLFGLHGRTTRMPTMSEEM